MVVTMSDVGSLDLNDDVFKVRENNGWSPLKRRKRQLREIRLSRTPNLAISGFPGYRISWFLTKHRVLVDLVSFVSKIETQS